MSPEYEPDRHVRDEQEQAQAREEIRRLFERYRTLGRRDPATTGVAAGVRPPDVVEEEEPALASH